MSSQQKSDTETPDNYGDLENATDFFFSLINDTFDYRYIEAKKKCMQLKIWRLITHLHSVINCSRVQ